MTAAARGPLHVTGELLATKKVGAYRHLTLAAPGIPERFRPGTFVALSVGTPRARYLARRCFWIHRIKPVGAYGPTIDLVVEPVGVGTRGWRISRPVPDWRSPGRWVGPSRCRRSPSPVSSWARGTPLPRSSRSPNGCASATARSPCCWPP